MSSTIVTLNTNIYSCLGKLLTLIDYSSGLPEIYEAEKLNESYDVPHKIGGSLIKSCKSLIAR